MGRNNLALMYLLFALAFGGMGFGMFFFVMLPELLSGQMGVAFPALFVLFVFGGVGVGMAVAFVKTILCGIRSRNVVMNGTPGIGTFIDAASNVTVNNTKYYKLTFSFRDHHGHEHIVKTRSHYYGKEVDILRERGTFEIKYIGNHAVATTEAFVRRGAPTRNAHVSAPTMVSCPLSTKNRKTCAYCGGESEVERNRCMFCGSHKFYPVAAASVPASAHARSGAQQGTNPASSKRMGSKAAKSIVVIIIIVMVAPFIVGIIGAIIGGAGDFGGNPTPGSSTHNMNIRVKTDWFDMELIQGYVQPSGQGFESITAPPFGQRLVIIQIKLINPTNEDCEMIIFDDFYVETAGGRHTMRNTGGNFGITTVASNGLFYDRFTILPGDELIGWVAFNIPSTGGIINFTFIYEEWEYGPVFPYPKLYKKHYYKFPLMSS